LKTKGSSNKSLIENGTVMKHKPIVVVEIWLFTILLLLLLITSLPMLRDIIFHEMGIYGDLLFSTPSNFESFHLMFGFLLIIIGIVHIALHSSDKNNNLIMKRPFKDFKGFLHSFFYLITFAQREEPGGGDRYTGRQRVVYLSLVYTIGLMAISGVALFLLPSTNSFTTIFKFTHVVNAIFLILILLFHFLINIRHHDSTALKCSYGTGKLPLWHLKKHHRIWYLKILNHEKKLAKHNMPVVKQTTKDPIAKALIKLYSMNGVIVPSKFAEELSQKIKKDSKPKEITRLIEISKTI